MGSTSEFDFFNDFNNKDEKEINFDLYENVKDRKSFISDDMDNENSENNVIINEPFNNDIFKYEFYYKKNCYKVKEHDLMFLTPAHLFFINKKSNKGSSSPPIYCRRCGELFTRDPNKKCFVCKKEKGGCSINMLYFKAYLMDLYNHEKLNLLIYDDENIYLEFIDYNGKSQKQMLCSPSILNEKMDKIKLLKPLPPVSKRLIKEKLVDLRKIIWCPFDYIMWKREDKLYLTDEERKNLESVFDIFFEKVDSPATSSAPPTKKSKRPIGKEKEENKEKKKKFKKIKENLKEIKTNAPSPIKRKLSKKGGITRVQNSLFRLTTPHKTVLNNENLYEFYIKGIEKNDIPLIKKDLSNIGIKSEYIENISFIPPDITEIVVYKSYEREFSKVINAFKNFEILKKIYKDDIIIPDTPRKPKSLGKKQIINNI